MSIIEDLFQRLHTELAKWEDPEDDISDIKGIISMLQVEVYKQLHL